MRLDEGNPTQNSTTRNMRLFSQQSRKDSRTFPNIPEDSRTFQKIPEDSKRRFQKIGVKTGKKCFGFGFHSTKKNKRKTKDKEQ
jgi:hypothetical protein